MKKNKFKELLVLFNEKKLNLRLNWHYKRILSKDDSIQFIKDYISFGASFNISYLDDIEVRMIQLYSHPHQLFFKYKRNKIIKMMIQRYHIEPCNETIVYYMYKQLLQSLNTIDALLVNQKDRKVLSIHHRYMPSIPLLDISSLDEISKALMEKKFLVISEKTISLDDFAYQYINPFGKETNSNGESWFELTDKIKMKILSSSFDVALIDANLMSNSLTSFVNSINKQAIRIK